MVGAAVAAVAAGRHAGRPKPWQMSSNKFREGCWGEEAEARPRRKRGPGTTTKAGRRG